MAVFRKNPNNSTRNVEEPDKISDRISALLDCDKDDSKKGDDGGSIKGKKKKCKSLEGENQSKDGPYHGGRHGTLRKGGLAAGRESHHMPATAAYPKSSPKRHDQPAIQMDKLDHKDTISHGRGITARGYLRIQKYLINKDMMIVAMAMDIADVKMKFGSKYDNAIAEMLLWSICMGYIKIK